LKSNSSVPFNKDWRFILGDFKNASSADFNDRTWKQIDLPHDWVISQGFNRGEAGGWTPANMQGFFKWEGICWYRKNFTLAKISDKAVFLYFGGAYRNSTIFINGKEVCKHANGYTSFEVDITDFAAEGLNNIAIRLDNGCEAPDRWYSGSGLYRDVYLKTVPFTHIKNWGVKIESSLSKDKKNASVTVTTEIKNREPKTKNKGQRIKGVVWVKIIGANGRFIAENTIPYDLNGKDEITVQQQLKISDPVLWSDIEPNLYRALVCLETEGRAGEPEEIKFGIRSVEIAYNKGMTVNGKKTKLKGVCLHHDAGITGSAYYSEVWRRRLNVLKSIGCNAIRTSHNPPAEDLLDLCDELGFYVIDECFDKWKSGYYESHFDDDWQKDLSDFILRDRNHPSIVMWSVGNEVENQGQDSMIEIQKKLVSFVKSMDPRPVTCALAPHANPRTLVGSPPEELVKLTKKLAKDVDVLGLNYHEPLYEHYTKGIEKPVVGTECYEYYSSVGTNFEDVCDKNPWQFVLESENVIGQFIWAGIDYLGESSWPAKGWSGSILDICAFYKPNAFFRKSIWSAEPFIYLAFYDQNIRNDYARGRWSFPPMSSHLNHEHLKRRTVTSCIFTTCEEAELYINGKKFGRRKKKDFKNGIIEWTFEYAQGSVEVKGLNDGKEACNYVLNTSGAAQKIKLISSKNELKPSDITHIEVNVTDKSGVIYPNDQYLIEFTLEGDAVLLGSCSSDLNQNQGYTSGKVFTDNGKALAIIKAGDTLGAIELRAYCEKLENAVVKIKVK